MILLVLRIDFTHIYSLNFTDLMFIISLRYRLYYNSVMHVLDFVYPAHCYLQFACVLRTCT